MQIAFERWIQAQEIDRVAKELFTEASTCYRASAYKAALLFSYLGFQTILRERILSSRSPTGIPSGQWQDIKNNLLNDDRWDPQVFDATQMSSSRAVFRLTDDVRNQVLYWKNRRNDCAHGKTNEITHAHVDAFWAFIKSNLGKFVVDGSKEGLLNEIKIHFDRSLTPSGADPTYLIAKIPTAVEGNQVHTFLEEVINMIMGDSGLNIVSRDVVCFFDGMFNTGSEIVTTNLVNLLKSRFSLLRAILRISPDKLQYFSDDNRFIRRLWYAHLFRGQVGDDMSIYCALLRSNLIPPSELNEAHKTIIERTVRAPTTDEQFSILHSSGFFDILRNVAFAQGDINSFVWANNNAELIAYYLDKFKIDKEIAKTLAAAFDSKHHAWDLREQLNHLFRRRPDKRLECLQVMQENGISKPAYLKLESTEADDESE